MEAGGYPMSAPIRPRTEATPGGPEDSGEGSEGGGLAGPVAPDDPEDFSRLNLKRHVAQCPEVVFAACRAASPRPNNPATHRWNQVAETVVDLLAGSASRRARRSPEIPSGRSQILREYELEPVEDQQRAEEPENRPGGGVGEIPVLPAALARRAR